MTDQTVTTVRRTRVGKNRRMIEKMHLTPGEWVVVKRNQSQHQAHAYASWLRRTYPVVEWVARRDGDNYTTFGRTIVPTATPAPDPAVDIVDAAGHDA